MATGIDIRSIALCRQSDYDAGGSERFEDVVGVLLRGVTLRLAFVGDVHFGIEVRLAADSRANSINFAMTYVDDVELEFTGVAQDEVLADAIDLSGVSIDPNIIADLLCHETTKCVHDLFFALNIARPGAIQLLKVTTTALEAAADGKTQYPQEWALAWHKSANGEWPSLRELDSDVVLRWLQGVDGFRDGFARDAIGRAVQALTYLLEPIDRPEQLLWVMVGLEALFTTGGANLSRQLRQRSIHLLGEHPSAVKSISEMYRTRSKFIHGKMNFGGAYHHQDASDEFGFFDIKLIDALDVGFAMLLAAVQALIIGEHLTLDFFQAESGDRPDDE